MNNRRYLAAVAVVAIASVLVGYAIGALALDSPSSPQDSPGNFVAGDIPQATPSPTPAAPAPTPQPTSTPPPTPTPEPTFESKVVTSARLYDSRERVPVEDGVDLNKFFQITQRDGILPVYDPQFVLGRDAEIDPGELVIGLEIEGESKAYAIWTPNFREMINDVVGGVPVLVTW